MINLREILTNLLNAAGLGKPSWDGGGATFSIKDAFSDITNAVIERGFMEVGSVGGLAQISGSDSAYAIVSGSGMYKYSPVNSPSAPIGSYPANGGGVWELMVDFNAHGAATYRGLVGNGVDSVYVVPHNLDTYFPNVQLFETGYGLPYAIANDHAEIAVVDQNHIQVTLTAGAIQDQYTVTVKK